MPLTAAFRRSLYASLALACACLAYAEGPFLPEMPMFTLLTGTLLVAAYATEGRWSLSLSAANIVGCALAGLLGLWVAYQFLRPPSEGIIQYLPWPTGLLPYLGPLLMVLVPAKLLRPKHVGDYWAMQGLSLMAVALGCALAGDAVFGLLLVCWLIVFAWNLVLFYLYRESTRRTATAPEPDRLRAGATFRAAGRMAAGAVGLGVVCFLATPRLTTGRWELATKARIETGVTADSQIDLNRTGSLNVNRDLAFEVYTENPDGTPAPTLRPDQRWRTMHLIRYENGHWLRDTLTASIHVTNRVEPRFSRLPGAGALPSAAEWRQRLPDLGPGRFFLTYRLAPAIGSTAVVADPVDWKPRQPSPIVTEVGNALIPWTQMPDGSFGLIQQRYLLDGPYHQVLLPQAEPDVGPGMRLNPGFTDYLTQAAGMPNLRRWTSERLDRLAQEGRLPPAARQGLDPFTGAPPRRSHEAVARALTAYLAGSGEFRYSTDLQRQDRKLDPAEDFLYNVRAGHCERFATALALMLRTQGIPTQLVLGFRGWERRDDGWYEVRQDRAHSWVEALVPRPGPPTTMALVVGGSAGHWFTRASLVPPNMAVAGAWVGPMITDRVARFVYEPYYYWLSLDPTPSAGADDTGLFQGLFGDAQNQGEMLFKDFILGYNSQARQKAIAAVTDWFELQGDRVAAGDVSGPVAIAAAVLAAPFVWRFVAGCLWWRRGWRRSRRSASANAPALLTPFHTRLLALLARHGFVPRPSQTAKEFATDVAEQLGQRHVTAPVAAVPLLAVDSYYRVRFGGSDLTDADRLTLDEALNRLETALSGQSGHEPQILSSG